MAPGVTAHAEQARGGRRAGAGLVLLATAALLAACAGPAPSAAPPSATSDRQFSPAGHPGAGAAHRGGVGAGSALVAGELRSPGGPFLRDRFGRVVFLHGVNAVYKYAPFELYPDPNRPWNLSAADARQIARLGFNVVRLGILWEGLEPGHGGPNNPAVCAPGTPGNPHMFSASVAHTYLARVARTIRLLGRYGIYTLLDMHQDVYNQGFRGEGAPSWAVCTDGAPVVALPGRWSRNYRNGALDVAVAHFWDNNVVGDLQGQFDLVWHTVARYFRDDPWVVGYDPYNEPFEREVVLSDTQTFAGLLECFYTGRSHPGELAETGQVRCPPYDPAQGVVPSIESADPHHLVFIEPDVYSSRGRPNLLGPMDLPNLVLNFHSYCGFRSPVTGDPTDLAACEAQQLTTMLNRERERPFLATRFQPGGPAWFMSEFGATHDAALLTQLTADADLLQLGWAYWSYRYYDDPTGSAHEALLGPGGAPAATGAVLAASYPQAIAGTPVSIDGAPGTDALDMSYIPDRAVHAPTVVFVAPTLRSGGGGYCAVVTGGHITSGPGAAHLVVDDSPGSRRVQITLTPGRCRAAAP